jgi:nitrate reductase gamma subunit
MDKDNLVGLMTVVLFVITIIVTLVAEVFKKIEERKAQERIKAAESDVQKYPDKAKYAWDLARVTLESYFNRNLRQISSIFWLSVLVMLAGFVIIGWGITRAINSPDSIAPAVIASVAGVITEFIGATFLFLYRSTIQQASTYTKTLERINSVGMAMQILDTIPDGEKDLKNKTKATLVDLIVRQSYESKTTGTDNTT